MSFRPTEASEGIIEANIFQECLTMNKIGYLLFFAGAMSPLQPPTMGDEFSLKIRLNDFPQENHQAPPRPPAMNWFNERAVKKLITCQPAWYERLVKS